MLPTPEEAEGLVLRQLGGTSLFAAKFREADPALGLYLVEKFWGDDARVKIAAQMECRGYSPL